ncbi:MAG: substrate-binding domain-containing protein [bacterium]|nr:substrate-binding domain-containing protein [bacterium]
MNPRRRLWLQVRVAIYLAVIAGLLLYRGGVPWHRFVDALKGAGVANPTLVIAGRDLAPPLLESLVAEYRRDYPKLSVSLLPGGTNHALEALLAREADVAFSYRNLTDREQALFREADGDTAIVVSVGLGGLVLLESAGPAADATTLSVADLREALAALAPVTGNGREPEPALAPYCARLYVCDPNEGSWEALFAALDLAAPDEAMAGMAAPRLGPVTFLADPASVVAAVAAAPDAWGLVSTLDAGIDVAVGAPAGTRFVGVVAEAGQAAVAPGAASIATGVYPLHHFLYAACRGAGGFEGGKFVTHLASARGLRQVERAGVLPARLMARTIQLSRDPVGGGGEGNR